MPKNCAKCLAENVIQASECASCGAKFGKGRPGTEPPSSRPTSSGGCLGWIVVLVVLFAGGTWLYEKVTGNEVGGPSSEQKANAACQVEVESRLVSPGSASFTFTKTWEVTDENWGVDGYVDSDNRFGASIRSTFRCHVNSVSGWDVVAAEVNEA